jgi:DNA-binding protein HU-beta
MNKEDLVKLIADSTETSKSSAAKALDAVFSSISSALCAGEVIKIPSFGSFSVSVTKEKNGRNPKTGDLIVIPSSKKISFKVSKTLKDEINKKS